MKVGNFINLIPPPPSRIIVYFILLVIQTKIIIVEQCNNLNLGGCLGHQQRKNLKYTTNKRKCVSVVR